MANMEESSPLIPKQQSGVSDEMNPTKPISSSKQCEVNNELKPTKPNSCKQSEVNDELKPKKPISCISGTAPAPPAAAEPVKPTSSAAVPMGWTVDGLPMGYGVVNSGHFQESSSHFQENSGRMDPHRVQWDSGLCDCFGRKDEFCSSDLEVCLLGSMAPCVLYGSNVERLESAPGTFSNHCLPYTGLFLMGQTFFGWNCLAPWFSYPNRTALRRKFNLEGNCEAVARSFGCCGSVVDKVQLEQCESACDLATHIFCHPCALCQEGRELRRRVPHPGFNAKPVLIMVPPGEQAMTP